MSAKLTSLQNLKVLLPEAVEKAVPETAVVREFLEAAMDVINGLVGTPVLTEASLVDFVSTVFAGAGRRPVDTTRLFAETSRMIFTHRSYSRSENSASHVLQMLHDQEGAPPPSVFLASAAILAAGADDRGWLRSKLEWIAAPLLEQLAREITMTGDFLELNPHLGERYSRLVLAAMGRKKVVPQHANGRERKQERAAGRAPKPAVEAVLREEYAGGSRGPGAPASSVDRDLIKELRGERVQSAVITNVISSARLMIGETLVECREKVKGVPDAVALVDQYQEVIMEEFSCRGPTFFTLDEVEKFIKDVRAVIGEMEGKVQAAYLVGNAVLAVEALKHPRPQVGDVYVSTADGSRFLCIGSGEPMVTGLEGEIDAGRIPLFRQLGEGQEDRYYWVHPTDLAECFRQVRP